VDRLGVEDLRRHYPELSSSELCRVDVIDDGERLLRFHDGSLDFIIANHMLEHCENPLGAMRNHLARLRPGGVLYYAVPDKRFTFDVTRPLTDFDHLVRDDQEGPAWSRWGHFLEWSRLVDKAGDGAAAEAHARDLMERGYSIHFHVWDDERFRTILRAAHGYLGRTFRVEWLEENGGELISVLRKDEEQASGDPLRGAGPRHPRRLSLLGRLRACLGWKERAPSAPPVRSRFRRGCPTR
jgi:SAM-dependent methyltransferase